MKKNFFNLQLFAVKKINLTKKADNYENKTANAVIYALAGNDTVENYYNTSKVTVFGGAGNDYLTNHSDKIKLSGDAGKDTLLSYEGNYLTLYGGSGNDWIEARDSDHLTITGGKGNDSIQLGHYGSTGADAKNAIIKYASGDGNDTIFGFDSNDTLHITSGSYTTSIKGNDYIVTVGKQKIILKEAVGSGIEKVIIKNSKGKLDIYNDWKTKTSITQGAYTANSVTLKAAKSGSSFSNYGDKVRIIGNNGADEISNYGNQVTISGGNGKDLIYNSGDKVSISGGAGNDEIGNTSIGNYVTVNGGKGNDYISMIDYYDKDLGIAHTSYKTVVQYANGDGKDTIRGFNSDDTIKITSGNYSAASNFDGDVIITVGKGSITLKNAAGQNIYITNAKGKTTKKYFPAVSSSSSTSALFESNNFVTSDNLSAITENDLTPTSLEKISSTNFENLATENNLITYSEK